jgi:hypothetical protein
VTFNGLYIKCHIPEDTTLHNPECENFKSYKIKCVSGKDRNGIISGKVLKNVLKNLSLNTAFHEGGHGMMMMTTENLFQIKASDFSNEDNDNKPH